MVQELQIGGTSVGGRPDTAAGGALMSYRSESHQLAGERPARAQEIAAETMRAVKDIVGFVRR